MNANKKRVEPEIIESFLNGTNPKKYVVAIEASYNQPFVHLVTNNSDAGKKIERYKFEPFLWFKHEVTEIMYEGKRSKILAAREKYNVKFKSLTVADDDGNSSDRLENGYRYIASCKKSYNDLILFFKEGGIDVFDKEFSKMFFMFSPVEQFMIQTGIRLFKGMDDYNDLHRFQFDLETEGISGNKDAIFQIGMRDNKGFEYVLETIGNTPQEKRKSERDNLKMFFKVINELKPDIITGYNSESFDWKFITDRCERLGIPISNIAITLDDDSRLKRKPSMLKLGNEMEAFDQTYMWGYNIIDIAHSVRRAQAINSDIKSWSLKYITKYSGVAKQNRVYVPGNKIYSTWQDTENKYAFNDTNGDWYKISDRMPLNEGYQEVDGSYIVQRYLLDDLWETEQIDTIFNQAAFLIAKLLPTTYSRSSTMGTASQWKLIMSAWSYENGLAIPETESKREFTGGLSRLLKVGYAKNVVKLDYAALYPKTQLTHEIFPNLDISGVMAGLLTYVVDTRDKFKFLTSEEKDIVKGLQKLIEKTQGEDLENHTKEIKKHKALAGLYDKKQLPLKILANSWFGAYGAPYIFNWGDTNCAEETTCRGRQYLRLMVQYFSEKYNFKPLVGDTDGFNFAFPDNINEIKYVAKGSHWKTEKYANQELIGLEAVLAEFNENYMMGRMGLDIDDVYEATINFSRKNYANLLNGKVKLVGNSVKSKKMPVYIEEFLDKAIKLLLNGQGKDFINFYHEYVEKIYNYNIPLVKIASKSKVKTLISDYKVKITKKNKAGNPMPRQAHMELALREGLNINLGDTIYYVNTGTSKSHGDIKTLVKSKMSKKEHTDYEAEHGHPMKSELEVKINCKLIDPMVVDSNLELIKEMESLNKMLLTLTDEEKINEIKNKIQLMESDLITDEYNVAKYLESFNKKVEPLLVCFHPDIRNKILISIKKDKKTKLEKMTDKYIFTDEQCVLVSGMPNVSTDQDDYYEDLMKMEDKEIRFWDSVNKIPNNIDVNEWVSVRADYIVRMKEERERGIIFENKKLDEIFQRLEVVELNDIFDKKILPKADEILSIVTIDFEGNFISRKWGEKLCHLDDIFKYQNEAIQRNDWYQISNSNGENRYELWLEYKLEQSVDFNQNQDTELSSEEIKILKDNITEIEGKLKLKPAKVKQETDEDNEESDEYNPEELEPEIDNYTLELQKADFEIEVNSAPINASDVLNEINDDVDFVKNLLDEIKNGIDKEIDEWNF
jgi:DNA polymerase elongation subunit (family B)